MILKKITPGSLYGRFLLITIIPVIITQAVATYVFYERHWESMSQHMASSLSGEMTLIVTAFKTSTPEEYHAIFSAAKDYMNLDVSFEEAGMLAVDAEHEPNADHALFYQWMEGHLDVPFRIFYDEETSQINADIQLSNGVMTLATSHKRLASPTTYIFITSMIGSATILMLVSIMFLRNQIKSIVRLTEAAEQFGKGEDMPSYKPRGAKEIRRAGVAFIEMKERIKRLISKRTQMLAGVSHDLRTPLTRMKLQLELMEQDEATHALHDDIIEMEHMLDGYLEFARDKKDEMYEESKKIDLAAFIGLVVDSYKLHEKEVKSIASIEAVAVFGKPYALKRAFHNLIDNAIHYGSRVRISTALHHENKVSIIIDDDGPGIPANRRREVFQPFFRVEGSRNVETGGIGLGLSICRDIIHRHGGEIMLDDSPLGGLRVVVNMPL